MSDLIPKRILTDAELSDLAYAKSLLENPGWPARLASLVGSPIEKGFKLLPKGWMATVQKASRAALAKALHVAVLTLDKHSRASSANALHKILVGASGGLGGVFGLAALPIELPISTTIMLRSIADIARSEGHELNSWEIRLACLEVFALGGRSAQDDAGENAYWIIRATLAKTISEATVYLAQRGVMEEGAPVMVRLIAAIASRFGVIVSEQVAAKAIPIVGAAAGSIINVLFIDHFQNMARGHFIVKRLEAKYGTAMVKEVYDSMPVRMSA